MCGICGIFSRHQKSIKPLALRKMNEVMIPRGPDSEGYFYDDNIGLGVRRLSIIDVISGDQPIYNEDKNIVVICNGEIYNYKELRKFLLSKGHRFYTQCDTEVLVHLYEEYGENFISRLEGMFAFALFDKKEGKLIIGRDFIGIKPLFYYFDRNDLIFASDVNAIMSDKTINLLIDEKAVASYLQFRMGPINNKTFFSNIHSLEPGHYIRISKHIFDLEIIKYHDFFLEFKANENTTNLSLNELIESLNSTLTEAVSKVLISDVPLGVLLSGGLDSSLISALANKKDNNLSYFSVGYNESYCDESANSKRFANQLGLKHHIYFVEHEQFAKTLDSLINVLSGPISHPNSICLNLITSFAKEQGIKVLLSGEGADELFGGYYRYNNLIFKSNHLPKYISKYIPKFILTNSNTGLFYRFFNFFWRQNIYPDFLNDYFSVTNPEDLKKLRLQTYIKNDTFTRYSHFIKSKNWKNYLLLIEQQTYLQELLLRQDMMSMLSSVEVRVPYLDKKLILFANSLPMEFKVRNGISKFLLRKVAKLHLPLQIANVQKVGFGTPINTWFQSKKGLGKMLDLLLDENSLFLNNNKLFSIVNEHRSGIADHHEILWKLLNIELWKSSLKKRINNNY